jgi:hypothetical protein
MFYQRKVFACPASSGASTSEKNWDRAFLKPDQFIAKYGESPEGGYPPESVPDATGCSV